MARGAGPPASAARGDSGDPDRLVVGGHIDRDVTALLWPSRIARGSIQEGSMATSAAAALDTDITRNDRATGHAPDALVAGAVDTMRSAAGGFGDRLPEAIDAVRAGATGSARTVSTWPEPAQRLLAAFSLGLGMGLTLAGAPRLVVAGALLPALAAGTAIVAGDPSGRRDRT
jgi:hypothetical protein